LVIKLDPLFIQAYHSLGAVYSFLQKSHEAKQTYEMALTQIPNELNTLILLGNLQADTGQTNEAEKTYLKASQVHVGIFLPHAVLGKFYLDNGKKKQGEAALLKAYTLNPNDANTNVLLGNVYRDFGRHDEAEKHYNRALEINPQDRGALRNLRRLLKAKIPYWHFEMLADVKRNEAYQKAIEKVVSKDSIVLDIGTGSGLLAMMAARAGSENVIACEMHPRLAQTAQEIISLNGYKDVVKVVAEKSTRLKVDQDLPSKANIIISEILDVGVLGEGVLPTIRHALQNLATKDVKLIPAKVNIYGQLIEIPSRSIVNPVKEISGFNLSPFEQYRIPDEYIRITLKAEKYRILSPVTKIIDFDFYNLPQAFPDDQERQLSIDFKINKSGSVQALVFWFDLYLDEEIVVSSRVDGELEHWGQALFCFTNPKNVSEGDSMTISLLQSDQYLGFRM
jgi:predicted RNA methylase